MRSGLLQRGSVESRGSVSGIPRKSWGSLPTVIGKAILPSTEDGGCVELFTFDKAYVERLREGDAQTEQHFVSYFNQLLRIKLRARMLAPEIVDDLRQETFIRVIAALRHEGGIRQPERFGAYVNSTCNNVLLEFYRSSSRSKPLDESHTEIADKVLDLEGMLVSQESKERVRVILGELPQRDGDLLRAIFLEEKEKDEVCHQFGVDRDYLRVLLHRAKDRFKSLYEKGLGNSPGHVTTGGTV
jgi:RNA polymerase sigma-70 factor (ECF subfamily)